MIRKNGISGFVYFWALCLFGVAGNAAAQALQSGSGVQFSLPSQNFVSNYYIDVTASAAQLTINLSATGGADVDLFVRYGTPFPAPGNSSYPTSPPLASEDALNRWLHYHSFSSSSSESVIVLRSSRVPLTAGRWYISVINTANATTNATLTATTFTTPQIATINVDFNSASTNSSDPTQSCDIAPWTDPTTVAPVGGNPGTTLGQQRQNALKYAIQQLTQSEQPPVPVTVHACWAHLAGSANRAIIAHATPVTFLVDEPDFGGYVLPRRYTWYSITEAVRVGGASQCGLIGGPCGGTSNEEIEATFNEDIGSSTVLGGEAYYYGYTADASSSSIDFVSIAMHELTHGLGFLGLGNTDSTLGPVGAKAGITTDSTGSSIGFKNLDQGPYDDIFDVEAAIVNTANNTYTPFMAYEVNGSGDAARAAAMISNNGLRWSEATAVTATVNQLHGLAPPQSFPLLYAPNPLSSGSSLSHTVQNDDLMNAIYPFPPPRTMGLAQPMLSPLGWSNETAAAPVYARPVPSNWFDVSHGGHGFDFQLVGHDPVFGDAYILVFYSFSTTGAPEWYFAQGNLVDGVFVGGLDSAGNTLLYSTYGSNHNPGQLTLTQQNVTGTVIVDFNEAANSPVCRDVDRSTAPQLGVMSWTIGSDSANWCMEPLITQNRHPNPDFNGHWYSSSDGGWGMEILNYDGNASSSSLFVVLYYPDPNGLPTWAVGGGTLNSGSANIQMLTRTNGYCRTCAPPSTTTTSPIGNLALKLTAPSGVNHATGTATFALSYPGGGSFSRTNDPITTLSLAPGQ